MLKILKNKKAIIWVGILIFLVISITYFSLSENEEIEYEQNEFCYMNKNSESERLIRIKTLKIEQLDKIFIAGEDIVKQNNEITESYIFNGEKNNDIISVFNDEEDNKTQRVYKISEKGIIEGFTGYNGNNLETSKANGKLISKITKIEKVEFNEKYLIAKIDCADVQIEKENIQETK